MSVKLPFQKKEECHYFHFLHSILVYLLATCWNFFEFLSCVFLFCCLSELSFCTLFVPNWSVFLLFLPGVPTWSILLLFLPGMFSVCSYWYILQGRADKTLLPVQAKPTDWICNCHLSHILHIAYRDNIWAISDFSELYSQAWERDEGTGANQWKLPTRVSWPIQIAHRGQVSISYPPPPFTPPPVWPEPGDYPTSPYPHQNGSAQTVLELPFQ